MLFVVIATRPLRMCIVCDLAVNIIFCLGRVSSRERWSLDNCIIFQIDLLRLFFFAKKKCDC